MASVGHDVASSNSNLSAPTGWTKKINPKKLGRSKRDEVVFLAPTGDEIKSKRQLELYLKSHPGGHSISEFDWSAGDGPRRSTRLSEKSIGVQTPVTEPSRKRHKKLSFKKRKNGKGDGVDDDCDSEDEVSELKEPEATGEDAKASENVAMIGIEEEAGDNNTGAASIQEVLTARISDMVSVPETEEKVLRYPHNSENWNAATDAVVGVQDDVVNTSQAAVEMAFNKEDFASLTADAEASSKLETEADDKIIADIKIEESVNVWHPAPELKNDCENAAKLAETKALSKLETEGADNDITLRAMEEQVSRDSPVELVLEDNRVVPGKQPSFEKEAPCDADSAKIGKDFKAADAEQANSHDNWVSTWKLSG